MWQRKMAAPSLTTMIILVVAGSSVIDGQRLSSSVQSFLREPFDQIATVGEHVTLPCRVINKRGVLQWTRDDFGLGSERELIGFDRYRMTGSDEEGKNNLPWDHEKPPIQNLAWPVPSLGAFHMVLEIFRLVRKILLFSVLQILLFKYLAKNIGKLRQKDTFPRIVG